MVRLILLLVGLIVFSCAVDCVITRLQSDDSSLKVGAGDSHGRVKRQMMKLATKWNGGQVNYFFTGLFQDEMKAIVRSSMQYISNRTCIKFVENQSAGQRLQIHLSDNAPCDSKLGAPGTRSNPSGQEDLNVGGCPRMMGFAIHEMLHSLGSFHEHSRYDRNDFLIVNQTEVNRSGKQSNMNAALAFMHLYVVPFDYGSVMMYDPQRFSITTGVNIMTPRDPDYYKTMGNKRVTFYDMERINKFYNCKCQVELPCNNGGYTSPGDCTKCNCPRGFFGKLCNERRSSDSYNLTATTNWQSKTFKFKYTETGENYAHFYSTFAYIDAPANKTIQVKIDTMENITCMPGCNMAGVEIKTKEDSRITSPLVCCADQEIAKKPFTSKNNPTIIDMFSRDKTGPSSLGFSYRYV